MGGSVAARINGPGEYVSPSARGLQFSFLLMAIAFSINHGCVTAVLALSSAELGKELSGDSSGTLYITYTLSALLAATGLVRRLGAKWSLVSGLGLYCTYVAAFLIAVRVPAIKWPAAIIGSAIGGTAAGWLWTAQGVYFGRIAERYAIATGETSQASTAWLASLFASIYVGCEVILKLASSFLYEFGSDVFVYTVFTVLAVGAAGLMWFVPVEPPPLAAQAGAPKGGTLARIAEAGKLLVTDARMAYISTFEVTFGLTTSFINFYVNGVIVKAAVGKKNIGYMAAIIPATATVLSIPYASFTNRFGKAPAMVFGCLSYLILSISVAALSDEYLESLKWGLVFIMLLGGNGRAVFEGTNKATIADFFPDEKPAAFANVIITSGGSAAIAFYCFPSMSKLAISLLCIITSCFGVVGVIQAMRINKIRDDAGKPDRQAEWTGLPDADEDESKAEA